MLKEVGVDNRRGAQNFCVTPNLNPQRELLALCGVGLAEQIGRTCPAIRKIQDIALNESLGN
jgi:hypothetical protein